MDGKGWKSCAWSYDVWEILQLGWKWTNYLVLWPTLSNTRTYRICFPSKTQLLFPLSLLLFLLSPPTCQVVSAYNDVLLLLWRGGDRPHKVHAPLLKWLKSHLRLHGNFILGSGFPHPLTPITLARVSPHILMKSGPILAYLKYLEGNSFFYKMTYTRPIMTGQEDVKDFLLPDMSSQDLIWAKFEEISPNLGERGTFPYYLALLFWRQVWWELC